jgi:hypothetical protein
LPGLPGNAGVPARAQSKVVEFAIRTALATNCQVSHTSVFARKNYFYPDLPKAYQISQYELPIAEHGCLEITVRDTVKPIGSPAFILKKTPENCCTNMPAILQINIVMLISIAAAYLCSKLSANRICARLKKPKNI